MNEVKKLPNNYEQERTTGVKISKGLLELIYSIKSLSDAKQVMINYFAEDETRMRDQVQRKLLKIIEGLRR